MKNIISLVSLALFSCLATTPVFSGDEYEHEADNVADTYYRPAPVMKGRAGESKSVTRGAARKTTTAQETGAGARAINGDECNPLCGMLETGQERAQPAQQLPTARTR
ncbi:MAG: hypothetical protein ABW146_00315 [Candidatus Sedimenticola sp. 6PFRAG7]